MDQDNELLEDTDIIVFSLEVEVSGKDKEEKERMISKFKEEFGSYIQWKGAIVFKVIDINVARKKEKKEKTLNNHR